MPPRQSDSSELVGLTWSTESLNELHNMCNALFGVEMAEAKATRFVGSIYNGTGCGGGKATFLQEQLIWLGRYDFALFFGECCERQDIGDGWVVDGKEAQEALMMIAGAATDNICHCMTLVTYLFKLCLVVLIHA